MSRGHGKIQQQILTMVAERDSPFDAIDAAVWIYANFETGEVRCTHGELVSIRRALRRLRRRCNR